MGGAASNLWNVWSALSQFYPPKPQFTVDKIPDLSGRIIVVTGEHLYSVSKLLSLMFCLFRRWILGPGL